MLNIIISLDYELFGPGSGDIKKHIIGPTNKILDICEDNDVPLTIMFEACEYMKFEEFDTELRKHLGYSPAELIKEQIGRAAKRGHDVQLHIHPQWVDAAYKDRQWAIKQYPRLINDLSQDRIYETLRKGKEKLINILENINPDYKCNTIRFTGYDWIEAPPETFNALERLEIKAHSLADYCADENRKGYWPLTIDNKVFEIPIHSIRLPKYKIFSILRILTALYVCFLAGKTKADFRKKAADLTFKSKYPFLVSFFKDTYKQKWDFCKQTASEMLFFLESALEKYDHKNYEIPLVMIGHSNIFFSAREFEKFLKITKEKYVSSGILRFSIFQEFVRKI